MNTVLKDSVSSNRRSLVIYRPDPGGLGGGFFGSSNVVTSGFLGRFGFFSFLVFDIIIQVNDLFLYGALYSSLVGTLSGSLFRNIPLTVNNVPIPAAHSVIEISFLTKR